MKSLNLFKQVSRELDMPVPWQPKGFFKDNKIMVIIVNEDYSAMSYWCNLPDSYVFQIKGRAYFLVAKANIRHSYPIILYYYNNPFPIFLGFQKSSFGLEGLMDKAEFDKLKPEEQVIVSNIVLDAESLHLGFNARIFKNLYEHPSFLNYKVVLIFVIVGLVLVLLILQFTGVIDLFGMLGMGAKK